MNFLFNSSAFRPSSINRFNKCNLHAILPQKPKPEFVKKYLQERVDDHSRLEKEEFVRGEDTCRFEYREVLKECGVFHKEKTLQMDIGGMLFSGTPDFFGFSRCKGCLFILDFKTGQKRVSAVENQQLAMYANLAIANYPENRVQFIKFYILNTKSDDVSQWEIDFSSVENFVDDVRFHVETSIEKIRKEKVFSEKGEHCFFCPSKDYCPLQRNLTDFKDYAEMDSDNLLLESLSRKEELENREKDIKSGEYSPYLSHLTKSYDISVFKDKDSLPEKLLRKKEVPISIQEARKILSDKEFEKYVEKKQRIVWNLKGRL